MKAFLDIMRTNTRRVIALTLVAGLATVFGDRRRSKPPPPKPPAEQPPVTFKVEVNYVEIDAIVTDSRATSSAT